MAKPILPLVTLCLLCIWLTPTTHAAEIFILSVDEWDRPHDDKTVISLQPLPQLVKHWTEAKQANADTVIEVRYPGGEMGELLAKRLYDWLVVLGIPSSEIILSPGSASVTQLELVVQ